MTPEACRDRLGDIAAAALGRLDGDTELRLRSHLDGCPACRAELADLRVAAAALDRADPARVDERIEPPGGLIGTIAATVARERARRRRHRRRRVAGGVAAAVAAAVAVFTLVVALTGDGADPRRVDVAFTVAPAGADAGATLVERRWGTEVHVEMRGMEEGGVYWLWLSGDTERRVTAGTFTGVPGASRVVMAAAMPFSEVRRVWVTDETGGVVLDADLDG